jgi:hypothetical protein
MRGVFWNIRGLGVKGRKQCIIDLIRTQKLEFIGIQETKSRDFSINYLNALSGGRQFCWNWLPVDGSAGRY